MKFLDCSGFERHAANNHRVEETASRPHICFKSTIALSCDQLWGNISWCATLFVTFLTWFHLTWHPKITNFYFTNRADHHILQLDITVQDLDFMQSCQPSYNLCEEVLRIAFLEPNPFFNVGKQVAPRTQLHYEAHVFRRLKRIIYLNHVTISAWLLKGHLD